MLPIRQSRAEFLSDPSADVTAADAYGLARALFAAGGPPGPQGLPNAAPIVTINLFAAPGGAEAKVNTSTVFRQEAPAIAALAGGGYVVVWQDPVEDGSGDGIFAQRYDSNRVAQGTETQLNSFTAGDQTAPAIAALEDGGYVVIWQSADQDGSGAGIYAQRFGASGVPQGGETRINSATAGDQAAPAIASLTDGGYVVAWQSAGQDGSGAGIYAQRFGADGVPQGAETRVNSVTTDDQAVPAIAALADGYVVAWQSAGQDGNGFGIYVRRYDASGVPQGAETRVNTTTVDNQSNATIAGLEGGGYVVAWQSSGQDGSLTGIYAQLFDADGTPRGAETRVNDYTNNHQRNPVVTALAGGGYVIAWQSVTQDGSPASEGVYLQRFDASGLAAGGETRVNTMTAGDQENPAVAAFGDGSFIVAFDTFNEGASDVYVRHFDNLAATEQLALNLKGRVVVTDLDSAAGTISVTLAVADGVLTVEAGTSGAMVSGSGTGTVQINGTLAQVRALLQTDASSTVSFTPDMNNPPATIALTVAVNDNGSTGDGGPRSAEASADIEIVPVNDAPGSFFQTRNIVLGNDYTFTLSDFRFSDSEGDALHSVIVTSLPDQGVLHLNGAPIAAGAVIVPSAIAAGALTFVPDAGEQGIPYTNFGWQARDDGGTANGGQDTDPTPGFIGFNISVNPVYVYGIDVLEGTYPTIQAGLDASGGFNFIEVAGGTYSGSVTFDVAGLVVRFDPPSTQNMTWTPVGTIGIEIFAGDGNDVITTGPGADTLWGNGGNDVLNGGAGADVIRGGTGDDWYYADHAGDVVGEVAGQGSDRLYATSSYALGAGVSVELLSTTNHAGTAAINLAGNEIVNTIYGNDGNNVLDGKAGADTMVGRLGDDWFHVDSSGDRVLESGGQGNDRVFAALSYTLGTGVSVELMSTANHNGTEAIALTGNELVNTIYGNAGNNVLDGKAGADSLLGLAGNDWFHVDHALDRIVESAGQGTDRVFASTSYALGAGVSVETLTTNNNGGTAAINLTGNELVNTIYGNAGANVLDGKAGADTLVGLAGDDWFYLDQAADRIVEAAGEGTDRALASTSYTLGAGVAVETLTTNNNSGTGAIALTGNELVNTIYGNAGGNLLDGKAGNDTLVGLAGADSFAFTTALGAANVDRIVDFAGGLDKLALDDAIFAGIGAPGAFNAGAFVAAAAAQDGNDRIVYNQATGQLFYDADGSGTGAAILFARLDGAPALGAADFAVI